MTSVAQATGEALAATPGLVLRLKTETFRGIATAYGFFGTAVGQSTGNNPDWSVAAAKPPGGPDDGKPDTGKPASGAK